VCGYHTNTCGRIQSFVTSAGTIDAKVVQVDAANDLALLKADGKFSPLPIAAKERKEHRDNFFAVFVFYCG
jgi:S1-C subfamily serine protease